MSEKRRQKKSSSQKNANANNLYCYRVLPKEHRGDRSDKSVPDQPKILQKPKEEKPPPAPVQISIAARPVDTAANDAKSVSSTQKSTSSWVATSTQSIAKEMKDAPANDITRSALHMKRPMSLISDFYQINNQAFDHIIETNAAFFVVGVIGPPGVGKSTILNLVANTHGQRQSWRDDIVHPTKPIFQTRQSHDHFSNMPVTEGLDIFINADRTILLDCSPVLCNAYKKELILSELDDLKTVMFLLTVCQTLIVVEEGASLNLPLIRLIQCAEKMKMDYDRDSCADPFTPNVLFVKNKCCNRDFLQSKQDDLNAMYKYLFKDSKLKIATDIYFDGAITDAKSIGRRRVNIVNIPMIDLIDSDIYHGHPDLEIIIEDFLQRVFMSSRPAFASLANPQTAFTEKSWSHLALGAWDSHKNNYFLRKYENFKEKEWPARI